MGYYVFRNPNDDTDEGHQEADLIFLSYQYVQRKNVLKLFGLFNKNWRNNQNHRADILYDLETFAKAQFFNFGTRVSHEPFILLHGSGWYEVTCRLMYCLNHTPNKQFKCKTSAPSHHRYQYTDLTCHTKNSNTYDDDDKDDYDEYAPPTVPPPQPYTSSIVSEYSDDPYGAFLENVSWLHYEIFERCKCFTQASFESNFDLEWVD